MSNVDSCRESMGKPVDFDFLFHGFEFMAVRHEFGFFIFGQRDGKDVGQSQIKGVSSVY
jgi:hypothetical protein